MKGRSRIRGWAALSAEVLGSLLLVLVLFSLFFTLMQALFPSGTPLKELVESRLEPLQGRVPLKAEVEATLSSLLRDVRYRRGNSIAWGGASEGMELYSQDAVQTFDRSGARIAFDRKNHLQLGSNTLVVVTRLDAGEEAGARKYRVQVDGELRGSLAAGRKLRMELAAAGHRARILPGAARFVLTRIGEQSESLAVYAGEVRVEEGGRVVRVLANYGVALRKGVPVGPAVPLPAPPSLEEMERDVYRYRQLPPRVRFGWSGGAREYHLQLSRERGFGNCLIDEKVGGNRFVTGRLASGRYYWRVSGVDEGREGAYSRVGRCELLQVQNPPGLEVAFPAGKPPAGPYLLTGKSEPGTRVFVDGVEVSCERSGVFRHRLQLNPGVNLIRVEALDDTGNASYASRIVYASAGKPGVGAPSGDKPREGADHEGNPKGGATERGAGGCGGPAGSAAGGAGVCKD